MVDVPLTPFDVGGGISALVMGANYNPAPTRTGTWTVPSGVYAITFLAVGSYGGYGQFFPEETRPQPVYGRRVRVRRGQQIRLDAGGVPGPDPGGFPQDEPGIGDSPLIGGAGSSTDDFWYGGAGGGASRVIADGHLLGLSGGGGGWVVDPGTDSHPPTNGWPTGGPAGNGASAASGSGGGGGGAGTPGGAAGGIHLPGENGGCTFPMSEDFGGPASPTWDQIGIDPATDPASARAVAWFYTPTAPRGWTVGVGW